MIANFSNQTTAGPTLIHGHVNGWRQEGKECSFSSRAGFPLAGLVFTDIERRTVAIVQVLDGYLSGWGQGRPWQRSTCADLVLAGLFCFAQMSPMGQQRMRHGSATIGGLIYVVGGKDEKGRALASMERYNPHLVNALSARRGIQPQYPSL